MSYKSLGLVHADLHLHRAGAHFSQLINLQLPLGTILVLLDGAQQEVDLGDNDFGQGVGPCRTAGAGAGASTEDRGL